MSSSMAKRAGSAVFWKGIQLAVTKLTYVTRLLILARLLSPDDFGLFAIAAVVTGVLLTLSDLGIAPALIQKEKAQEGDYLAAWTFEMLRALAIAIAVLFAAPMIANLFGEPRAVTIIQVLAIRPLLVAAVSVQLAKLNRNLDFKAMAALKIPSAFIDLLVAVALADVLGVWALVAGIFAGETATLILAYVLKPWKPGFSLRREHILPLVSYGRWVFLTGILALAGQTVLQAVIARKLGAAELGLFYLAMQLARLPSDVLDQVVGPVAFPLYARLSGKLDQLRRAVRTIFVGTSGFLIPAYALLIAVAPSLASNVLGAHWSGTGPIIQVLALAGMVSVLSDVVAPFLYGVGQPHKVTLLETVQVVPVIGLVWYFADMYGVVGAAGALVPAVVVSQVVSAWLLKQTLDASLRYLLPPIVAILAASMVGAAVALAVHHGLPGVVGLAVSVLAGALVIFAIVWFCDVRFQFGIRADILQAFPQLKSLPRRWREYRT